MLLGKKLRGKKLKLRSVLKKSTERKIRLQVAGRAGLEQDWSGQGRIGGRRWCGPRWAGCGGKCLSSLIQTFLGIEPKATSDFFKENER